MCYVGSCIASVASMEVNARSRRCSTEHADNCQGFPQSLAHLMELSPGIAGVLPPTRGVKLPMKPTEPVGRLRRVVAIRLPLFQDGHRFVVVAGRLAIHHGLRCLTRRA